MESVKEVKRKCKGKENRSGRRYGFEFKLRLEEGLSVSLLGKEVGICSDPDHRPYTNFITVQP